MKQLKCVELEVEYQENPDFPQMMKALSLHIDPMQIEDSYNNEEFIVIDGVYDNVEIVDYLHFLEDGSFVVLMDDEGNYHGWKKDDGMVECLDIVNTKNISYSCYEEELLPAIERKANYKNISYQIALEDAFRDIACEYGHKTKYLIVNI